MVFNLEVVFLLSGGREGADLFVSCLTFFVFGTCSNLKSGRDHRRVGKW